MEGKNEKNPSQSPFRKWRIKGDFVAGFGKFGF
jgi:hypothetical protein